MEDPPGIGPDRSDRRQASFWSGTDLWALAELFALTGLAIAQPVLDVFGRSPDVFLFRRADRLDILLLVAGVTVLPALCIWVVEVLVGLVSGTVRRHLHLVAIPGSSRCWPSRSSRPPPTCAAPRWPRSPRPAACSGARCTQPGLATAVAALPYPGPAGLRAAVRPGLPDLRAGPADAGSVGPGPERGGRLRRPPPVREVRDGPANWKVVLAGETDTLVRGSEGVRGLYRFGAAADLVYRDPATVGPIRGAPATAVLDDGRLLQTIEPGSGSVPALVSGRLATPPPPGATVLVAVNGRIGGGSRPYPDRPGEPADRFAVITPDFLWRAGDGHRQLQLYLLERGGAQPCLQPVSVSAG